MGCGFRAFGVGSRFGDGTGVGYTVYTLKVWVTGWAKASADRRRTPATNRMHRWQLQTWPTEEEERHCWFYKVSIASSQRLGRRMKYCFITATKLSSLSGKHL